MSNTTAVEIFKDEGMTKAFTGSLAQVLPKHLTADKMAKIALSQIRKNPKIGKCTKESFANCMIQLSEVGLTPGTKAHLIPYGNECTLILDYKGVIELVLRSGKVDVVDAFIVRENDTFEWKNGEVSHEINPAKDRGEAIAVYSYIKYKSGAVHCGEPMTKEDVEKVRNSSPGAKKPDSPWNKWPLEMWKKTVIKRDAKKWPTSADLEQALDFDNDKQEPIDITDSIEIDPRLDDEPESEAKTGGVDL